MAVLDDFMTAIHGFTAGGTAKYRFWSAGGTGLDVAGLSVDQIRNNGESCAGMLNAALIEAGTGITPPGGVLEWIAAISDSGPADPNASYPIGTFMIESPNAVDTEGHIAVVSGPGNLLAQSDSYTMTMNEGRTLADMAAGNVFFDHSGPLPALGASTGSGSSGGGGGGSTVDQGQQASSVLPSTPAAAASPATAGTASGAGAGVGSGIAGILAGLASALSEGFGWGIMKAFRYGYAYLILRPIDLASGFFWEVPRQEVKYTNDNGNSFWDRWWNLVFIGSSVYLAFGRSPDGVNWSEKLVTDAGNAVNMDTKRKQQPASVSLATQKVGAVRVGAQRANRIQVFRDHRPTETRRLGDGTRAREAARVEKQSQPVQETKQRVGRAEDTRS